MVLTSRAVEVLHDQGTADGPNWRVGSGYLIGGRLVLTAAHNVGDGNCEIRLEGGVEVSATVLRRGNPRDLDLAVVEITDPSVPPIVEHARFALVSSRRADLIRNCVGLGFPRFKEDPTRPSPGTGRWLRAREQLDGDIPTGARGSGLLTFRVTARPERPPMPANGTPDSPWAGISGTVVFARLSDDDRVVGVVTEHHLPEGGGALTVVSLAALDGLSADDRRAWWNLLGVADPQGLPQVPQDRGRALPDLRSRLQPILDHHSLVGGRNRELAVLDAFRATPGPQYLLVTGQAGTGKTALLAAWIRRLRPEAGTEVVYHFISRQFGTAAQQDTMISLVSQAAAAWGRAGMAPGGSVPELEARWLEFLAERPPRPVVVVLDGADEAGPAGWRVPPTLFPRRPAAGVHVVVSARTVGGADWRARLGLADAAVLTVASLDDAGVRAVVDGAVLPDWVSGANTLRTLLDRVGGDPFYLRVLVDAVRSGEVRGPADLEATPTGLRDYLAVWWQELTGPAGQAGVAALLGHLAVARGPLRREELVAINPTDPLSGFTVDAALSQIDRFVVGDPVGTGVALAHWRLQQYLAGDVLSPAERDAVRADLMAWCDRWAEHRARYALRHGVAHHLERADTSEELARVGRLLSEQAYQQARIELADDAPGLFGDLDAVVARLASRPDVPVTELARAVLESGDARERWLRPELIFEQAGRGEVEEAVRGLAILGPESTPGWRQAAALLIAWQALGAGAETAARRLLDDIETEGAGFAPLDLLLARVRAQLCTSAEPELSVWFLPQGLPAGSVREEAVAAVERLGGSPFSERRASGLPSVDSFTQDNEAGTYLAEADAPHLVAYARDSGADGDELLSAYVDLHAANPYAVYRNRSLWSVLAAVCCLPRPDHALEHALHLAVSAFAASPVRFTEYASLAVLAQRTRLGDRIARDTLERLRAEEDVSPEAIRAADQWGHRTRRLAAHAEVAAVVLGDAAHARTLLRLASTGSFGFAGFRAPACLAVAEAYAVTGLSADPGRVAALDAALHAAHNVQDPVFSAVTTARVGAVRHWWASSVTDVGRLVSEFAKDPGSPRFSSRHRLGERFDLRTPADHIPIGHLTAITRRDELASALGLSPPTLAVHDRETDDGTVALPDPGFAPVMAAWLAAQVLVDASAAPLDRARRLASLVLPAAADPTLLDLVLGRLVAALPEPSTPDLDELERALAGRHTTEPLGGREAGVA